MPWQEGCFSLPVRREDHVLVVQSFVLSVAKFNVKTATWCGWKHQE